MPTKKPLVIYLPWKDFRLADNPALSAALTFSKDKKIPFLPIFTLDNGWVKPDIYNLGHPRRWALSQVLAGFAKNFNRFEVVVTEPEGLLNKLVKKYRVYLFVNDDVEPFAIRRHQKLAKIVEDQGSDQFFFKPSNDLSISKDVRTGSGNIYSIFTPFKNKVWEDFLNAPTAPKAQPESVEYFQDTLETSFDTVKPITEAIFAKIDQPWTLKYNSDQTLNLDDIWSRPNLDHWPTTEQAALKNFDTFNQKNLLNYEQNRNDLELETRGKSTSRMSMALAWGLVSARTLKDKILHAHQSPDQELGVEIYLTELIWREFYRYILWHHPGVLNLEYREKFQGTINWIDGLEAQRRFENWVKGETGYSLVDAAMRQLASQGWMHNRCRMVVASILTKNLGLDWRWGQDYFRATLIDLDEASNNGGWQWSASVGADPKPIRIFNPSLQAKKYDPQNKYQQKWLPKNYQAKPIVEHKLAREEARQRYKQV